nr:MAG TPA: hypothetical protein [Bacteriophage sp.]
MFQSYLGVNVHLTKLQTSFPPISIFSDICNYLIIYSLLSRILYSFRDKS